MFVLASVIDITVRKQTEKTAQIHARRVEAVNKELAAYTSAISHDLRAPLRAIRNYVSFLIEDIGPGLAPKPKHYLDALRTAVREADRMILDLLKLGRLDAPGMPAIAIDLGELFAEIRRSLDLPKDVHFITSPRWPDIEAPRVLLLHIFQNLIGNAIKFNTSSPKRVEIGWRSAEEGNVEFYVKDNGIGIDPLYHDRVFDVFERLNPPGQYEGAGLGLSLVKKAVDVLDGRIRVESQPNKGSTFFVTIPKRRYPNE
jgi:signal transduction histidine kinase